MIDIYLGRQSIFTPDLNTHAYEIMHYSNENGGDIQGQNSIDSALSIVQTILDVGVDNITQGKPAFFLLTGEFLCKQKFLPFKPDLGGVILTVSDDEINEKLITTIRRLKYLQYEIIFDNARINRATIPLLDEIKMGRVDISQYSKNELEDMLKKLKLHGLKVSAAQIADHQTFEFCKTIGFDFFQGDFITHPQTIHGRRLPSRRLFVLKMLTSLYNPEIDIRDLEIIVRQDVSLGYKLMRMVNSAYYGLNNQIESIQHALVFLGINPLRAW
jgi:EAL and modified HD-GYP domain-containing signal transduction protein